MLGATDEPVTVFVLQAAWLVIIMQDKGLLQPCDRGNGGRIFPSRVHDDNVDDDRPAQRG